MRSAQMLNRPCLALLLAGVAVALPSCAREINEIRSEKYIGQPQRPVAVTPSVVTLPLRTTADGRRLDSGSVVDLTAALESQGRLSRQAITLVPRTSRGQTIARRLGRSLIERGLPSSGLHLDRSARRGEAQGAEDLTLITEAVIVRVPDCAIADPTIWTVSPFTAVGSLGCANRANLASMVSDPRDLISSQELAGGDGIQASESVKRYHTDNVRELAKDTNFKSK